MSENYDFLAANLLDSSIFSLIGSLALDKKFNRVPQVISYSNFRLDVRYAPSKVKSNLISRHFTTFLYECGRLHTVFFESENPAGTTSVYAVDRDGRSTSLQSKKFFFTSLKAYDTIFLKANDSNARREIAGEIEDSSK